MKLQIFNELTTEEQIVEIEKASEVYNGMIVDMDDADERRDVKAKASEINNILKKLDRKRIDIAKDYKKQVDLEAGVIVSRLEAANKPLTSLIDQYNVERAKILKLEKEAEAKRKLIIQIKKDHEEALNLNIQFDIDKAEEEKARIIYEENLKKEAIKESELKAKRDLELAEQKRIDDVKKAEQALIDAEAKRVKDIENALQAEREQALKVKLEEDRKAKELKEAEAKRMADVAHKTSIKTQTKLALMEKANISEEDAINIVKAICKNEIETLTIKF